MKKIMELLQNMKAKNEKKDNKGFSLVELIIVIAIMAILVHRYFLISTNQNSRKIVNW